MRLILLLFGCSGFSSVPSDLAQSQFDLAGGGARVFITSDLWPGNMGGIPGVLSADLHCTQAGQKLGGSFRAWISDSGIDATDRVLGNGPWLRVDGATAFAHRPGFSSLVTLDIDENGHAVTNPRAWTGSDDQGRYLPNTACDDWTTVDGSKGGQYGDSQKMTEWSSSSSQSCDSTAHLYCFESG